VFARATFPTARTFRRELLAAGIAREDDLGRVLDFHSLRVTFVSSLAAAGVHPKIAQALARHYRRAFSLAVPEGDGAHSVAVSFRRLLPIES
jgi:hypothetical protein